MNTIEEIALQVRQCTACNLSQSRTNAVPGEGASEAEVMFIGEGPGFHEDKSGRPFVGPAGQFLDDLLRTIGLRRERVFIANMIKCRPPQNRDPLPGEMTACNKYLDRQIELINPKLIVTLGRFSLGRFFPGESITKARGKVREKDGRHIYPIMHPAAALHRQENRAAVVNDFRGIPDILAKLSLRQPRMSSGFTGEQATEPDGNQAPEPRQLSLFTS
jgi:DNA polymerase